MKTDKINFTGFKNVGAVTLNVKDPQMPIFRKMIIELTNEDGDHLARFRKMLEEKFPFEKDSNRLHLDVFEFRDPSAIDRSKYLLSINSKPIEAEVENIAIVDEIADLAADISEADAYKLSISKKYLEEPGRLKELTDNSTIDFNITKTLPVEDLYSEKNIKVHGNIFYTIFDNFGTSIIKSSN